MIDRVEPHQCQCHVQTHDQSTGIRLVKSTVSAAQCITKCIRNGTDKEEHLINFAKRHFLYIDVVCKRYSRKVR
jgi:hypothetical protein